eukprot:9096712-Pyramimonas_sp.AAC.1
MEAHELVVRRPARIRMEVEWLSPKSPREGTAAPSLSDYLPDHPNPTRRPEFRVGGDTGSICVFSMSPDPPPNWKWRTNRDLRVGLG